jgi:predicted nucleic acid-binding protein
VAWAEFLCGPLDQRECRLASETVSPPEPFTAEDAVFAAELFNRTGWRKHSQADCMIAAMAIRIGAKLATTNKSDFQRFLDLTLAQLA